VNLSSYFRSHAGPVLLLALGLGLAPAIPLGAQAMDHSESAMAGTIDHAMAGHPGEGSHIRLTPAWPAQPGDRERAESLLAVARGALAKYQDPAAAEADGYRVFAPKIPNQPVYHYTNYGNALVARFRFDPTRPTSLLYAKGSDGTLHLLGAMYTMPAGATLEELDQRVPLSVAHWHQHINICLPPRGDPNRLNELAGPAARFGPRGSIATEAACSEAGGRFLPRLFGWMVHVNLFAGDDPAVIWGGNHQH
jgi:hypothetical protein